MVITLVIHCLQVISALDAMSQIACVSPVFSVALLTQLRYIATLCQYSSRQKHEAISLLRHTKLAASSEVIGCGA